MTQTFTTRRPSSGGGGNTKILMLALALGVTAVILNFIYIHFARSSVVQSSFTAYVLNRKVIKGDPFRKNDYLSVPVPDRFQDTLNRLRYVSPTDVENYVGRRFETDAAEGELLTTDMFFSQEHATPDLIIPDGYRAVSLPINSRTVPGMLRKGMYVDIEAPFNLNSTIPTVLPVLERVQIMALGTSSISDQDDASRNKPVGTFSTMTIVVKPEEATELAMIERIASGEFELEIRNSNDPALPKIPGGGINPAVLDLIANLQRENPGGIPTNTPPSRPNPPKH